MSVHFDEKWLKEYCARTGLGGNDHFGKATEMVEPPEGQKRTKYNNRKVTEGGRTFDSQHERDVYNELLLEARAGKYCAVLCQVAFTLPGGVKYIADFVTLEAGGKYEVWDAKSSATAKDKVYRLKKRLMRECLGIEIREV